VTATVADLLPGMMFLRHTVGWQGRAISAMQAFVRGGDFWTHAGLILDGGWYIQAQPGGAKLYPVADLFDGRPLLVSDAPVQQALQRRRQRLLKLDHPTATCAVCDVEDAALRARVAREARALEGADYSFLDYPALGLAEWARAHPQSKTLARLSERLRVYINCHGHLICSALVDRAYANAGVHLFDNRMPGDVTPEDLAVYAYADGRRPLIDTSEDSK
jgi:hypothetical protein